MPSAPCWHCHNLAQMVKPVYSEGWGMNLSQPIIYFPDYRFVGSNEYEHNLIIYSCVACGFPNIAEVIAPSEGLVDGYDPDENIVRWLHVEPLGKDFPDAPEEVRDLANEVHKCIEIGANRAAVVLARTTLQNIVDMQDKEHTNEELYERLRALAESGTLKKRTADAANVIRLSGNSAVHDGLVPVDRKYAEIVVKILDSVIEDLYTYPSLVDEALSYAEQAKRRQKEIRNE